MSTSKRRRASTPQEQLQDAFHEGLELGIKLSTPLPTVVGQPLPPPPPPEDDEEEEADGDADDDDDDAEGDDGMIKAETARASRAARSPPPSAAAVNAAWQTSTDLAAQLEASGLTRITRQPVVAFTPKGGRASSRESHGGGGGVGGA